MIKKYQMLLVAVCFSIPGFSQMKVFTAPLWADTLHNPLKGNTISVAEGKNAYKMYCSPCHGEKGKGDGVAASGLQKPPADHTSAQIQKQSDGALYWMISTGNTPMPSYKGTMTDAQIWQLVSYIRTLGKTGKK